LTHPQTINTHTIETELENDVASAATITAPNLDRKAVLKGIQGMSMEERAQLLDELIINVTVPVDRASR
jgi:hypothetical protein